FASQEIIIDEYFSPYSGAASIQFAQWGLLKGEDTLFPLSEEVTTAKIWGRLFEMLGWSLVNSLGSVTQHEVFGHGYRLRELGITPSSYSITPWSGGTSFGIPFSDPAGNYMAITIAGLEANAIMGQQYKMHAMQAGCLDGRSATLYTASHLALFDYIIATHESRNTNKVIEGNDIEAYLALYNSTYPTDPLTLGQLTRWSLFSFLDPMTIYTWISEFYYIAFGEAWVFPVIELTDNITYLPNISVALAPYGPEAYLQNFFSINDHPLYGYIKGAKRGVGLGIAYDYLLAKEKGSLGGKIDLWRQHQFITSATVGDIEEKRPLDRPELSNIVYGVAASLIGRYYLTPSFGFYAELGGKTAGYLPGYSLGGSLTARIGLSIISGLQ
ncbi:MAG: hypothetical protein P0S94_03815, partial [Simkaniaceae bacterium]|nr:hypothetical protein [Simkaniaceae bacterium]